jgi:hypothetical protein
MPSRSFALFWRCIFAVLALSRLAHEYILWADEDYHLAATIQVLHGKIPYRDFWYDKPPLTLAWYLLTAAKTGVLLRIAGTVFELGCCLLIYLFAAKLWSRTEGMAAAALLAFFLVFYLPPGVMPLEPDTLMLAPHIGAIYLAWQRKPFLAGLTAGVAFLLNAKGALVLAACLLFDPPGAAFMVLGFVLPNAATVGLLFIGGALHDYWEQVWRWSFLYAGAARGSILSFVNWLGFHAALVIGAVWLWFKERPKWPFLLWLAASLAGVALGWRFAPRYFMQLLPVMVLFAARGLTLLTSTEKPVLAWVAIGATLAVPLVRFGPRYVTLIRDDFARVEPDWRDIALDEESRNAAHVLTALSKPGDTIFIWGYRPGIIAYTRMPVASRLWDSQPVTGVPADRHLTDATPLNSEWARENRQELARSHPTWIADGLSAYNPALDIHGYSDLAEWFSSYCETVKVGGITLYRRCR